MQVELALGKGNRTLDLSLDLARTLDQVHQNLETNNSD